MSHPLLVQRAVDVCTCPLLASRQPINPRKRLKAESVALEGRIRAVKDLKAETLEKTLEAERQVMLWEKKTQLERETQVKKIESFLAASYAIHRSTPPNHDSIVKTRGTERLLSTSIFRRAIDTRHRRLAKFENKGAGRASN